MLSGQMQMPTLTVARPPSRLAHRGRIVVLLALGAWLVHQLRYTFALSHESAAHAEAHGHEYLSLTGPLLFAAVALATTSWIFSLTRERSPREHSLSAAAIWLRASLALLVVFCVQETAEGLFSPHHPQLVEGIFGSGGWIAVPLSVAVAGVIALAMRGARAAREAVARAHHHLGYPARPLLDPRRPSDLRRPRRSHVLAGKLAGRAPPLAA